MVHLLHQLLEDQALRVPDNVVLEYHPGVRLTYQELNEKANQLARYLEQQKTQKQEVVALCLEKGPMLVIAIIAVLKAGMVWVPIPLDAPPTRVSSILKASDTEFAFCSRSTRHILENLVSYAILDDVLDDPKFRSYPGSNLLCERKSFDLCHILFTSGSTGVPKGVALEHGAVMHNVRELVKEFSLPSGTRTLQFAAPTFDVFSLDIFMTISCGGCLVMAPLSTMIADMATFMREASITYAQLTPTILDMIDSSGIPSLKILVSSGETLSQNLAARWRNRVRLFNAYGQTETIVCAIQELGESQVNAACIGRAIYGLEICLFTHESVDIAAEGEVGEICVAGPQLFRGYISTEKKLTSNECFRNGKRYYRTGDLGRTEACAGGGNTLRYLGRQDGQVKGHGIRTDLGDVEQSILACEVIKQCKEACIKQAQPFSMAAGLDPDVCISIGADKCRVERDAVLDLYPCTAMQEALMISSTKSPGAFLNRDIFQLADGTSPIILATAIQAVWARHNILRTRIVLDDKYRSFQVVVNELVDVPLLKRKNIEEYLQEDDAVPPGYGERLSWCKILTCGMYSYLVISQHHAVFDRWSTSLLLSNIEDQYSAKVPLASPLAFASFIQYLTELRKEPKAALYWQQNLKDARTTALPQIKVSKHFETNQKDMFEFQLPPNDKHQITTIVEAAWALLLCRYTETDDVSFGSVRSGRTVPLENIDSLVGPTIVTVPRRIYAPRGQRVSNYLEKVDASIAESLPWEQFSHQNIRKLGPGPQNACQFSSLLVIQTSSTIPEIDRGKILIPQTVGYGGIVQHDCLIVKCQPRKNNKIDISFIYDDSAIASGDVYWIAHNFSRFISELLLKPDQTLRELDIAGSHGAKQVQKWNSHTIVPSTNRVDDLFSERVCEWPSLIAVNSSDAILSYLELHKLSSKLAARLQALGIGRGHMVPLFMTKSAVVIIAMLAILKAGATYVPLALDTPQKRLRLLLGKLSAKFIVCTPDQASNLVNLSVKAISCDIKELM